MYNINSESIFFSWDFLLEIFIRLCASCSDKCSCTL